jgi:hypothetical protein
VIVGLVLCIGARASAQTVAAETVHPELRADVIASTGRMSIQAGGGVQIPAGYYARIGIDGALGMDDVNGSQQKSGRVDVLGRFLFDPFRQTSWGISAGAGVSVRAHEGDRVRPLLLAVIDVEGKRAVNGISPALQVGLGGGMRVGGILRWGSRTAR